MVGAFRSLPNDRRRLTVLLDANVLYSKVLSDYLVQARRQELLNLRWSSQIMDEMIRNKEEAVRRRFASSDERRPRLAAVETLRGYVERAYPDAFIEPSSAHFARFESHPMPDPDDRHVVAAAVAADADYLCTSNVSDFPEPVMTHLGIRRVTPDALLDALTNSYPVEMVAAHQQVTLWSRSATHRDLLNTLRRAQAPLATDRLERLLGSLGNLDSRDDLAQVYASAIAERDRARTGLLPPSTQPPNAAQVSTRPLMGHRGRQPLDQQRGAGG